MLLFKIIDASKYNCIELEEKLNRISATLDAENKIIVNVYMLNAKLLIIEYKSKE